MIILHFNIAPDGSMFCLAFDAGNKDLVPENKGLVRASIPIGGWKFEKYNGNPNQTLCTYMAELDLKGSVPGWVLK